jgi:DtxR family Mn-dependent transcriptional regulator
VPSSTVENYLKTIFRLSGEHDPGTLVATGRIAEALHLTPGTVTTMVKHLERDGYLRYEPRRGVRLRAKGQRAAAQVLRRHRLIELFLVEFLRLAWAHVHEEAELLEHALSDRIVERIDEMLGRPAYDPHGDPIPGVDGVLREDRLRRLSECSEGEYTLVRVAREDSDYLTWLQEHGLIPGARLRLEMRDKLAGILLLRLGQSKASLRIGEPAASSLWVREKD